MKGMLDKKIWLEQFHKSREGTTARNMLSTLFVLDKQIHGAVMVGGISAFFVERELSKTKNRNPPAMH